MSTRTGAIKAKKKLTIALPEDFSEIVIAPAQKEFSEEEFWQFCAANKDLRIELTNEGYMIIMSQWAVKGRTVT